MSKGFGNMMRQAQVMQKQMEKTSEALKTVTTDGESGQGKIKVVVTCGYEVKSISIDKDIVDPADLGMLEDLIVVAVNDAMVKAKQIRDVELGKLTGGLPVKIPGFM